MFNIYLLKTLHQDGNVFHEVNPLKTFKDHYAEEVSQAPICDNLQDSAFVLCIYPL